MSSALMAGVAIGQVAEVTSALAVVAEESGISWQIPRTRLPATLAVGDSVTLCVLAGRVAERDVLARAVLNELLGSATA